MVARGRAEEDRQDKDPPCTQFYTFSQGRATRERHHRGRLF